MVVDVITRVFRVVLAISVVVIVVDVVEFCKSLLSTVYSFISRALQQVIDFLEPQYIFELHCVRFLMRSVAQCQLARKFIDISQVFSCQFIDNVQVLVRILAALRMNPSATSRGSL